MVQETLDPDSEPEFEFSSELLVSGFVCAAIGAGIGYIIGLLSAEDDLPIRFVSDRSVLRLTDYAHYNFRNLEKLNQDLKFPEPSHSIQLVQLYQWLNQSRFPIR